MYLLLTSNLQKAFMAKPIQYISDLSVHYNNIHIAGAGENTALIFRKKAGYCLYYASLELWLLPVLCTISSGTWAMFEDQHHPYHRRWPKREEPETWTHASFTQIHNNCLYVQYYTHTHTLILMYIMDSYVSFEVIKANLIDITCLYVTLHVQCTSSRACCATIATSNVQFTIILFLTWQRKPYMCMKCFHVHTFCMHAWQLLVYGQSHGNYSKFV